jgi:hypothetical protein
VVRPGYIAAVAQDAGETVQNQLDKYPSDIFTRVEAADGRLDAFERNRLLRRNLRRKSGSLLGPRIMRLSSICPTNRGLTRRVLVGSRRGLGTFWLRKTTLCIPTFSGLCRSKWDQPCRR